MLTICYHVPNNKKDGPCRICGLAAFLIVILYMLLSGMGIEIKVGSMLGNNVNIGIGSILTGIIVSAGMILLGIYLKRIGER